MIFSDRLVFDRIKMESSAKNRLFTRTRAISVSSSSDFIYEIRQKFQLPETSHDLKSTQKRIHQCAFALTVNHKNGHPSSDELFQECQRLLNQKTPPVSEKQLIDLEERVALVVLPERFPTAFGDSKRLLSTIVLQSSSSRQSSSSSTTKRFSCTLEIEIPVLYLSKKEQLDPELRVFFSRHMVADQQANIVKILPIRVARNIRFQVSLEFDTPSQVNGHYAVLRFFLYAQFKPQNEDNQILPYTRKRPYYNGHLYVSDLQQGGRYKVSLYDSCLAFVDGKLARINKPMTDLVVTVQEWNAPHLKIVNAYSEETREKQRKKMESLLARYYEVIKRARPYLSQIKSMHVPRMPCNMHDILLPGAMFVMDMLENSPPECMLDYALDMNNMKKQDFIEICRTQFASTKNYVEPAFNKVLLVACRMVCMFSHACEYAADVKVDIDTDKLEDVERFIDAFSTGAADCEDLAKAIVVLYIAWTQREFDETKEPALYYIVKVMRLFVPCAVTGSAYSPSAKSRGSFDPDAIDSLICHIYALAVPWHLFHKWNENGKNNNKGGSETTATTTMIYSWEVDLFPWILEGTSDTCPTLKPLWTLAPPSLAVKVKSEMQQTQTKRIQVENYYPALRCFGLYSFFSNFTNDRPKVASDFYHMITELWAPYDMLRLGYNDTTFEVMIKGNNEFGLPIQTCIFTPDQVAMKPIFTYSDDELEICLETLKQQHPVVFPDCLSEQQQQQPDEQPFHNTTTKSFSFLNELFKDFGMTTKATNDLFGSTTGYIQPYIRYFVKNIHAITTDAMIALRTILKNKFLGIYGFDYRYYPLDKDQISIIEIRLFFSF